MRKLIYTQSSGFVYSQLAQWAVPLMSLYAKQVGAEMRYEATERKSKYPLFDKYKVGELLDEYDRVLFLDCDILVRPDSPDIFALVPEGHFAAFNEGSHCVEGERLARLPLVEKAAAAFGIDASDFDMTSRYFNGGVFLADKIHRDLFDMPVDNKFMLEVTAEQNVINLRLAQKGYKTFDLPIQFNAMPWKWSDKPVDDNWFIHYAGLKSSERIDRMTNDYHYILSRYVLA